MAEEKQDIETLKRRGLRRLIGAVALVLAAVIVLPMVFDPEPRGSAPTVSARIPGENETPFTPKPPVKKAEPPKAEPAKPVEAPTATPPPPPPPPESPKEEFVVQVGAFSNPQSAIAKLKSAKIPYHTEKMQGNLTRVRVGPFDTRQAAEKAREQLKALGFEPGSITTKSG